MTKSLQTPPPTSTPHSAKPAAPTLRAGRLILDTTWRIAVPVILFAGIGIFVDRNVGTAPFVTLVGVIIGFVFAAILVKKQIVLSERVL